MTHFNLLNLKVLGVYHGLEYTMMAMELPFVMTPTYACIISIKVFLISIAIALVIMHGHFLRQNMVHSLFVLLHGTSYVDRFKYDVVRFFFKFYTFVFVME